MKRIGEKNRRTEILLLKWPVFKAWQNGQRRMGEEVLLQEESWAQPFSGVGYSLKDLDSWATGVRNEGGELK